jgi:hypothetical protein
MLQLLPIFLPFFAALLNMNTEHERRQHEGQERARLRAELAELMAQMQKGETP